MHELINSKYTGSYRDMISEERGQASQIEESTGTIGRIQQYALDNWLEAACTVIKGDGAVKGTLNYGEAPLVSKGKPDLTYDVNSEDDQVAFNLDQVRSVEISDDGLTIKLR
jgi:hypothetical protein